MFALSILLFIHFLGSLIINTSEKWDASRQNVSRTFIPSSVNTCKHRSQKHLHFRITFPQAYLRTTVCGTDVAKKRVQPFTIKSTNHNLLYQFSWSTEFRLISNERLGFLPIPVFFFSIENWSLKFLEILRKSCSLRSLNKNRQLI